MPLVVTDFDIEGVRIEGLRMLGALTIFKTN
jgi:hypothetical protein